MTAIYIPAAPSQSAPSPNKAGVDAKNASDYLAKSDGTAQTSVDGLTNEDGTINSSFFEIAFSQITSSKRATVDTNIVNKAGTVEAGPQILAQTPQVNNLADFGKAFNFDPVLNLTSNLSGEALLSKLDQAGQNDLIEQLIGSLPADVIGTAFEGFNIGAGIEGFDIPRSAIDKYTPPPVISGANEMNLYMQPVQPLQPLQGQPGELSAIIAINSEGLPETPDGQIIAPEGKSEAKPVQAETVNVAPENTNEQTTFPALIATGLTPAQMAALSSTQTEDIAQDADVVDVTLVSVLPVNTAVPATAQTGLVSPNTDAAKSISDKLDRLAGQNTGLSSSDLKALKDSIDQLAPLDRNAGNQTNQAQTNANANANAGQVDNAAQKASHSAIPFSAMVEDGFLTPEDLTVFTKENAATSSNRDLPFHEVMANNANQSANATANKVNTAGASQNAADVTNAKAQAISSTMGLVPWETLPEMSSLDIPLEGMSLGQILHNTVHTSPTLMHAHATLPHQATQTIAAKMTQNATQGGDTEIQIELDPPELGRVKIQMIADNEGGIRAQLSFDKPETFLMMQRDSAQLEKSLSEAGIDIGENGLEFSLSSDNQGESAKDGEQNGSSYASSGSDDGEAADGAQDVEILTTKMDWYTDQSGTLRLDMLA